MKRDEQIIDLDNPAQKRMVLSVIKNAKGLHWFTLTRCRDQRSLRQNAYLWGVVYPVVARAMGEAWGENVSSEEVHEFYKQTFLSRPLVNRASGESMGTTVGSTSALDKAEMSDFIDQIVKHAAEYLGAEVPPPTERFTPPAPSNGGVGDYTGHTPRPARVGGPVNIWPALS